ncbi:MAG: hypothetical protein LBC21_02330 [Oscillospiraceae bacterium]|nr:hypothetical protein [Oscillospiraceae bacterium]
MRVGKFIACAATVIALSLNLSSCVSKNDARTTAARSYSQENRILTITEETVESLDFIAEYPQANYIHFIRCTFDAGSATESRQAFPEVYAVNVSHSSIGSFGFMEHFPNSRLFLLNGCSVSAADKTANRQALANVRNLYVALGSRDGIYELADTVLPLPNLHGVLFDGCEYVDLSVLSGCGALVGVNIATVKRADNIEALLDLPKFADGRVSERYVDEMPLELRERFDICRGIGNLQYRSLYPGAPTLTYLYWTSDTATDGAPGLTAAPPSPSGTRLYSPESRSVYITGETIDSFDFLAEFSDVQYIHLDRCTLATGISSNDQSALGNIQFVNITLPSRESIYEYAGFFALVPNLINIDFALSEYVDLAVLEGCGALVSVGVAGVAQVDNWEALCALPSIHGVSVSEEQIMTMPPALKERFNIVRGMGGAPLLPSLYPGAPYLVFMDWTYDPAIDLLANQDPPQPQLH